MNSFFKKYVNGNVDLKHVYILNQIWTMVCLPITIGLLFVLLISSAFIWKNALLFIVFSIFIYYQKLGVYKSIKNYTYTDEKYEKMYKVLIFEFIAEIIIYFILLISLIYLVYDILK